MGGKFISRHDVQGEDFRRLWEYSQARGGDFDPSLSEQGLRLHDRLQVGGLGYSTDPGNAACFASTGGDGVHFDFLLTEDRCSDDQPVIMCVPMQFDRPNVFVADSLRDFLNLGCRFGFFNLEQLCYEFDKACDAIEAANQGPAQADVLVELEKSLQLQPWTGVRKRLLELERELRTYLSTGR